MFIILKAVNKLQLDDVHVYRMELPEHSCPWGLKAIKLLNEQGILFQDHKLVDQESVETFKLQYNVATTPQIFNGESRIGGYTELTELFGVKAEEADYSYVPVIAVFGTAILITIIVAGSISSFMGYSISILAMLKLMDIEAFATSFKKYDLLSKKWSSWAKLYPGIELLVGLGFLMPKQPLAVGLIAIIIGILGMISVYKAVYIDKLALNCACVGGNSKTPLGIISFIENLIMAGMGIAIIV